jgi:hypothetical protein
LALLETSSYQIVKEPTRLGNNNNNNNNNNKRFIQK